MHACRRHLAFSLTDLDWHNSARSRINSCILSNHYVNQCAYYLLGICSVVQVRSNQEKNKSSRLHTRLFTHRKRWFLHSVNFLLLRLRNWLESLGDWFYWKFVWHTWGIFRELCNCNRQTSRTHTCINGQLDVTCDNYCLHYEDQYSSLDAAIWVNIWNNRCLCIVIKEVSFLMVLYYDFWRTLIHNFIKFN